MNIRFKKVSSPLITYSDGQTQPQQAPAKPQAQPQEKQTQQPQNQSTKPKSHKYMKLGIGAAIFVAIAAVLLSFGVYAYYSGLSEVEVEVTNLLPNSATLVWVSETEHEGMAIASVNDLGERQLGQPTDGQIVGYDDRDYARAELQASNQLVDSALAEKEIGDEVVGEVEVTDMGKYKIHHVTFTNLDPSTKYNFMVGNGYLFRSGDIDSFTTKAKLEEFSMPAPAYGVVLETDEDAPNDGVLKLHIEDPDGVILTNTMSTALAENGSWYLDLSNLYTSEGNIFLDNITAYEFTRMMEVHTVITPEGTYVQGVSIENNAPSDDFVLEESQKLALDIIQPAINNVRIFDLLVKPVEAEASGCSNRHETRTVTENGKECTQKCGFDQNWSSSYDCKDTSVPESEPTKECSPGQVDEKTGEYYCRRTCTTSGSWGPRECTPTSKRVPGEEGETPQEEWTTDPFSEEKFMEVEVDENGDEVIVGQEDHAHYTVERGTMCSVDWEGMCGAINYECLVGEDMQNEDCWRLCVNGYWAPPEGCYDQATTQRETEVVVETGAKYLCCENIAGGDNSVQQLLQDLSSECPDTQIEKARVIAAKTCDQYFTNGSPGSAADNPLGESGNPMATDSLSFCVKSPNGFTGEPQAQFLGGLAERPAYCNNARITCRQVGSGYTNALCETLFGLNFEPGEEGNPNEMGTEFVPIENMSDIEACQRLNCGNQQECSLVTNSEAYGSTPNYECVDINDDPLTCSTQYMADFNPDFHASCSSNCNDACSASEECRFGSSNTVNWGNFGRSGFTDHFYYYYCLPNGEREEQVEQCGRVCGENEDCYRVATSRNGYRYECVETEADSYCDSTLETNVPGAHCSKSECDSGCSGPCEHRFLSTPNSTFVPRWNKKGAEYYVCEQYRAENVLSQHSTHEECRLECGDGVEGLSVSCGDESHAAEYYKSFSSLEQMPDGMCRNAGTEFHCVRQDDGTWDVYYATYYCTVIEGGSSSQIEESDSERLSWFHDLLVKGVGAQETEETFVFESDLYYLELEESFVFKESGNYVFSYKGDTYQVPVENDNKVKLYIDVNNNAVYDNGLDELVDGSIATVPIAKVSDATQYFFNEGYNLVSFDFVSQETSAHASEFLSYLNRRSGDAFYSIAEYDNGSWRIIGQRNGVPYGVETFMITPGKGYLLRTDRDVSLTLPGLKVTNPIPVSLSNGWNLVSIHGSDNEFTAESWLDSIDGSTNIDVDNVTKWDAAKGKYDGLQMSPDSSGQQQIYGFDYPILEQSAYFVKVASGSGTWTPQ